MEHIGNGMGLKIGSELRKGANLVPLHFLYRGRGGYESWVSFIGKDACDALRDWFAVRGWPNRKNPYVWPISRGGKSGRLTARDASNAYSRLAVSLGLRPSKGAGSWVRYGVGSIQVRNLAVARALLGGADDMIVHALAGHKVDWEAHHWNRPDEKLLEQSYGKMEPFLQHARFFKEHLADDDVSSATLTGENSPSSCCLVLSGFRLKVRYPHVRQIVPPWSQQWGLRSQLLELCYL
jgi:hypothetical protein